MATPYNPLAGYQRGRLADMQMQRMAEQSEIQREELGMRRQQMAEQAQQRRALADYQNRVLEQRERASIRQSQKQSDGGVMTAEGYMSKADAIRLRAKPASMLGQTDIDDESARNIAVESLYDANATTGYRRSPAMMAKIMKHRTQLMKEGGITPEDVVQGRAGFKADTVSLNKITPMYDAVTSFENTAKRNGKILIDLAKKVDQTGVPVIERWIRAGRQNIAGDPDVSQFNAQLNTYRNEAARILTNPNLTGVLTVESMREAEKFLQPGASADQIEKTVKLLERDFDNRKVTLEHQIQGIRQRMGKRMAPGQAEAARAGTAGVSNAPGAPAPAAAPAAGLSPDELKELEQLRARFGKR